MPTHDDADQFRERIRQLRRDLGLRVDYEFKFSKTHSRPERREAFFRAAVAQEFRFAVSSINKTKNDWDCTGRREKYRACLTELSALLRPTYCRAEEGKSAPLKEPIVLDENSDRDFLAIAKQQFHALRSNRHPGLPLVAKVLSRGSASDEMLQLVDMVCGAACELIQDDNRTWYNLIAERDVNPRRVI